MGRPHVGPMLAFRCADRGLIALRSTSQNVDLDEGKIIMALASTAALMLMKKKKKDGCFDTAIRWRSWEGLCQPRVAGVVVLFYVFPATQADQLKFRVYHADVKVAVAFVVLSQCARKNGHPNHVWSRCWVQGFYFLPLKCPPGPPPLHTPHSLNCHKGQLHNIKYHKNPTVVVSALEHLGEIDHECRLDKLSAHPDPQMTHTTTRARTYTPESKRKLKGTHTRGEE